VDALGIRAPGGVSALQSGVVVVEWWRDFGTWRPAAWSRSKWSSECLATLAIRDCTIAGRRRRDGARAAAPS